MTIGVLALQGDFAEHREVLSRLGAKSIDVRTPADLEECDRLILPGGESTVISRLLRKTGLWEAILQRHAARTLPLFGTCAGAILLAKEVTGKNPPETLGLLDITIDRNAYGTQLQSFETELVIAKEKIHPRTRGLWLRCGALLTATSGCQSHEPVRLRVSFVRAPMITRVGKGVEILAEHEGHPVLVRHGDLLAAAFHTEVTREPRIHELFLSL